MSWSESLRCGGGQAACIHGHLYACYRTTGGRTLCRVKIGLILPQGFFNEFEDWPADRAWQRMLAIAQLAERLGFDSLWTGEHVLARWGGTSPAFDCFTIGAALAAAVPRVGIGFIVLNSTFRNPVLTAKAAATLDAVSGGRLVLGLGAGFIEAEAQALGTPFPPLPERLRMLEEHFAIVSHLTSAGRPPPVSYRRPSSNSTPGVPRSGATQPPWPSPPASCRPGRTVVCGPPAASG